MRGLILLTVLSACSETDERPHTLAYITETILAPSCGTAECHSAMKRQNDYAFDTVENAEQSIRKGNLVIQCAMPPCQDAPSVSSLLTVISDKDVAGNRMPLDEPLANLDVYLIGEWIIDGSPGYQPTPPPPPQ